MENDHILLKMIESSTSDFGSGYSYTVKAISIDHTLPDQSLFDVK